MSMRTVVVILIRNLGIRKMIKMTMMMTMMMIMTRKIIKTRRIRKIIEHLILHS